MRKILFFMASVALLFTTACDKKKDNNNNPWGYAPNSCYASGTTAQYRWANGQCIDIRNNQPVANVNLCNQANYGNSFDPRCNTYGGFNNGIPGGGFWGGNNFSWNDACTQYYGPGWVTSRGIMGELICVNSSTWGYINSYYGVTPYNMGGYYQTCIPSSSNCNCRSFGGTLGWVSGGGYVGYCF